MTDYNSKYYNIIKMKCCSTYGIGYKNIINIVMWRTAFIDGITVRERVNNSLVSRFIL